MNLHALSSSFKIRRFVQQDMPAVLDMWNRTAGQPHRAIYHPLTERKVRAVWLEKPDFDPEGFFVAEDEQGLAGGIMVNGNPGKDECGRFDAVFTRTGCLHEPVAQAMMDHALAYLSARGLKKVATTSWSHPDSRDIEMMEFLWFNRFVAGAVYDPLIDQNIGPLETFLGRNLEDFTIPEWVGRLRQEAEGKGFGFRSYREDKDQVPLDAFDEFPFSSTFRRVVQVNSPLESLFLAYQGQRIVGGAMASLPYAPTDWMAYGCDDGLFGPTGVARTIRGHGIGKVLLFQSVYRLRELNCRYAWIPTNPTTYPFYAKAGFSIARISVGMQRALGDIHVRFREVA